MTDSLQVTLFDQPIGDLAITGAQSPEDWYFTYQPDYLASSAPVPLSVALPLQADSYQGAAVRNWFCNLLPEGGVREAITARLRIAPSDDFALLAAIGGECAGAVSIQSPGPRAELSQEEEGDLETLLYLQGEDAGEGAWALLGTPLRLSLAGAQDKIAVIAGPDGRLRLPGRDELSTHILKPDSRRFRGLRDLEALGLALARTIGLPVAPSRPVEVMGRQALLIERYDRATDGNRIQRLHQEDFCQALGYPGEMKYESQGGPGLARCSALIRQLGLGPAAVQGLLDWAVFNALIGNADAHAKNLALLCDRQGYRRLAPFYDLVPTVVLPESLIERAPALRIGAAARIEAITAADWRAFAAQSQYAPRFVLNRVVGMANALLDCLNAVGDQLIEQGCDGKRIASAIQLIANHVRQLQALASA
ncbi:MAG TPA: type II toxin-antitoxin system HipA family toxin [Pseudoxanthomonas sp.]|nr:type II toxin-antitoxin system HipA family toxin [Pseudoxanthomonas sp.]